ncbi:hypothetical protein OPIT5_03790 [Opitutaceae bacterium TAV5]|nr:hypothetical protein OPIT5_03790 [Opitutaceae bacterium TAV5]
MHTLARILAFILPFAAAAQTLPPPSFVTVTTNPDGTLRAPADFWTANEAAIVAALDGAFVQGWADLPGMRTSASVPSAIPFSNGDETVYLTAPGISIGGYPSISLPFDAGTLVIGSRTISASGLATGGGNLTANRTITVTAASNAEATAGTATNRAMTPASTRAAIDGRPQYAKVTIQMPEGFTDAELKLATDNYASGTLTVYIHTPDLSGSLVSGQVIPVGTKIYYTCTGATAGGDTRKIRALPLTDSGGVGNKIDASGRVGSITFYIPVTATIKPTATNLSWTYNLMTYAAHEQDSAGHSLWREATAEWVSVAPAY